MPATLEIVCDESGFAGGNLVGPGNSPVFAHASLTIGVERAAGLISALRAADRSRPGEFKASRLRQAQQAAAAGWLLSQAELTADHALLHLTDTRFFVLARTVDALLGDQPVRSIDSPGATPALHRAAGALYRASRRSGDAARWNRFLVAAANLLRTHNRWLPPDPLPRFAAAVESALATEPEPEAATVLARLRAAGGRAAEVRVALEQDRRSASLMEPLLPALMRAIEAWGARTESLTVIHDEQSALTPGRIAEMGARLSAAGGRLESVQRVDSRDHPRVQVADLLAGLGRRWAAAALARRSDADGLGDAGDLELGRRLQPLVDLRSVWVEALPSDP
jgi:Protein of unknown function (DUF3800)